MFSFEKIREVDEWSNEFVGVKEETLLYCAKDTKLQLKILFLLPIRNHIQIFYQKIIYNNSNFS